MDRLLTCIVETCKGKATILQLSHCAPRTKTKEVPLHCILYYRVTLYFKSMKTVMNSGSISGVFVFLKHSFTHCRSVLRHQILQWVITSPGLQKKHLGNNYLSCHFVLDSSILSREDIACYLKTQSSGRRLGRQPVVGTVPV